MYHITLSCKWTKVLTNCCKRGTTIQSFRSAPTSDRCFINSRKATFTRENHRRIYGQRTWIDAISIDARNRPILYSTLPILVRVFDSIGKTKYATNAELTLLQCYIGRGAKQNDRCKIMYRPWRRTRTTFATSRTLCPLAPEKPINFILKSWQFLQQITLKSHSLDWK